MVVVVLGVGSVRHLKNVVQSNIGRRAYSLI